LSAEVLIAGDPSHKWWIQAALGYLPDDVLAEEAANLTVIGLGGIGACRLPPQYREREVILISDWVFPPAATSEGDDSGRFCILTILHEIAHAVCRHKSPRLDQLSVEEIQGQEAEADTLATQWFNTHVEESGNKYMLPVSPTKIRDLVERFGPLCSEIETFKRDWHSGKREKT